MQILYIGVPIKLHRFSMISRFLEGILMEHIGMKLSSESQLQIDTKCSVRTPTRKLEKTQMKKITPTSKNTNT